MARLTPAGRGRVLPASSPAAEAPADGTGPRAPEGRPLCCVRDSSADLTRSRRPGHTPTWSRGRSRRRPLGARPAPGRGHTPPRTQPTPAAGGPSGAAPGPAGDAKPSAHFRNQKRRITVLPRVPSWVLPGRLPSELPGPPDSAARPGCPPEQRETNSTAAPLGIPGFPDQMTSPAVGPLTWTPSCLGHRAGSSLFCCPQHLHSS